MPISHAYDKPKANPRVPKSRPERIDLRAQFKKSMDPGEIMGRFVERFFHEGALVVRLPDGRELNVGGATAASAPVIVRITDWKTVRAIVTKPHMAAGEAFMGGTLVFDRGTIYDLLEISTANFKYHHKYKQWGPLSNAWAHIRNAHGKMAARRNAAQHYDLSMELYRRFLDADLQYSCAYFTRPDATLEEAQLAKKRLIAAKLRLFPGAQVLDIGCGWGGLAMTLAEETGAYVSGITLSKEQLAVARQRAEERGLNPRTEFGLTDYRDVNREFDRVVSVGMLEHVGEGHYGTYFNAVARLLKPGGVALIHTIAKADGPSPTDGWARKYIFPGGYIPALSQLAPAIERAGLMITDMEVLRLHYAETLREWRKRFMAQREEIKALYDERFCRMWEFYLAGSEASFRVGASVVLQFQLAKKNDAVPITRDYLFTPQRVEAPRVSETAQIAAAK